MSSLVTRDARQIARETQDALVARDLQGLAFVAVGLASGVVIAQEIADRILPLLGFAREPSGAVGFVASGAVKFSVALLAGVAATSLSGMGLVFTAFVALGHLAGAGADLFNAIQRTGFFAEAPSMGGRGARSSFERVESASASTAVENSGQQGEAYTDGGEIDPLDTGSPGLEDIGVSTSYA